MAVAASRIKKALFESFIGVGFLQQFDYRSEGQKEQYREREIFRLEGNCCCGGKKGEVISGAVIRAARDGEMADGQRPGSWSAGKSGRGKRKREEEEDEAPWGALS